jgi:hypothetical protein
MPGRRLPATLAALCALALAASAARAEIYRWTDEQGVERFSDRIENVPERFRHDVTADLRHDPDPAAAAAEPLPPDPAAAQEPAPEAAPETSQPLPEWGERLLGMGLAVALVAALGGLVVWLVLVAWVIRLACRVVGEEVPAFGRALGVAGMQLVAGVGIGVLLGGAALAGVLDAGSPAFQGVQILATFGVNAAVLRAMLGQSFGRALVVTLVSFLITLAIGAAIGVAIAIVAGALLAGSAG